MPRSARDRVAPGAGPRKPPRPSAARTAATTTAPTRSRSSRASRPSASGRPCTSGRPGRRACTTSSTRSSTTRSTRRSPASARNVDVTIHIDGSVTVVDDGRGIPVDMHESGRSAAEVVLTVLHAGGKFENDSLQGVRRPARRRRVGRQRAVGVARARDLAQRPGAPAALRARHADRRPRTSPARTEKRGTKITFKPDAQIFETTEFSFETLSQRLRELAFLNAGVTITIDDERDGQEPRVPVRGRHPRVRRVPEQEQDGRQREADLHDAASATASIVEIALQWNDGYTETTYTLREQHQHDTRAARTSPASARRSRARSTTYASKNNLADKLDRERHAATTSAKA